jgi:hypothetical protein
VPCRLMPSAQLTSALPTGPTPFRPTVFQGIDGSKFSSSACASGHAPLYTAPVIW